MKETSIEISKYQTNNGICIVKSDTYQCSFALVSELVKEAKKDFPELKDKDISIKVYNDKMWKNQLGIEFNSRLQPNYKKLNNVPHSFN